MTELRQILELWRTARANREEVCLASVVAVEGSSYRKPGARMLLASGGRRTGTVSGGCIEAEVQKKAWWLTEAGATVQRYSSFFDEDSEMPYGLGCGGTISVLLERGDAAEQVLAALALGAERRAAIAIVSAIDTNSVVPVGVQLILAEDGEVLFSSGAVAGGRLDVLARRALDGQCSFRVAEPGSIFVEYVAPPIGLFVFGAGDDAQPLVEFAHRLGWETTVADGRSHLATAERFPLADTVLASRPFGEIVLAERDAAVILTHSYEQDRSALRALLGRELRYLGILGPRLRTERLLSEVGPGLDLSVEECFARLHSPVGLNLGAQTPAGVALAIVAEIHAVMAKADVRRRESAGRVSSIHG